MQEENAGKDVDRKELHMREQDILVELANILTKNDLLTPDENYRLLQKIKSEVG